MLTLADLKNPALFECLGWVPWFDEHEQYDAAGNLVRDVDKQWLESFCRNNNERGETGDFTAFGPGHTVPHVFDDKGQILKAAKEGDQPPHWGYLANWDVRPLPDGTLAAGATRYVKKRVELPTSLGTQHLAGPAAVRSFPWRSIEYSRAIHAAPYAALLRKPPARDIGATISFARGEDTLIRGGTPLRCSARKRRARAAVAWGDRVYFSMEMNMAEMPDPSNAPDAMAPDDDFRQKFERCMTDSYPHLGKMHDEAKEKYEAAPAPGAIPGPNNVAIPGPDKKPEDDDMDKFSRDMQAIMDRKYAARVSALEAENAANKKSANLVDAKSRIKDLANDGYIFDPVGMLQRFERLEVAERDAEMEHVRKHYRKTDSPPTDFPNLGEPERFERTESDNAKLDRVERAKQHMRTKGYSGEAGWEKALAETK